MQGRMSSFGSSPDEVWLYDKVAGICIYSLQNVTAQSGRSTNGKIGYFVYKNITEQNLRTRKKV